MLKAAIGGKLPVTAVIGRGNDVYPPYTGEYEITPKFDSKVSLSTANKVMRENVTVHKVPRYDISNEAGGTTVFLGGKFEDGGQ